MTPPAPTHRPRTTSLRRALDTLAAGGLELRPAARRIKHRLRPPAPIPGLVSIIMPVRNRAKLACRAAASVAAQTYQNWELIIVDDGSSDLLRQELRPLMADRRLRLLRQAPRGAAAARNTGLRFAVGALVAYLDSDNEWAPGFLAGIVPAFADPQLHAAYGILITADGTHRLPPFDRASLIRANAVDLNVFVHRRRPGLFFDEALKRLIDWDFILRCTSDTPALPVPVPGAIYHETAPSKITATEDFIGPLVAIRRKWRQPLPIPARPPRILYALWQYPQQSEMYMETEIAALRRRGAIIEVWSETEPSAAYKVPIPVHRGTLAAAIAAARPDVVHTHWLNMARQYCPAIAAAGLPYTIRAHGFDATQSELAALLPAEPVKRIYAYRSQKMLDSIASPKLRLIDNAFDTNLFRPGPARDRSLVLRASAALPAKDLELFLTVAKQLPRHRFVLAIASCTLMEDYVGRLLTLRREIASPAEIKLNLSHAEIAALMGQAGIYLHTLVPPETPPGTPLGQPGSIGEALASGCLVLHRRRPELASYVGSAGLAYDTAAEATALIAATETWDTPAWQRAEARAVEWAWTFHTGDETHDTLYRDWLDLAALSPPAP